MEIQETLILKYSLNKTIHEIIHYLFPIALLVGIIGTFLKSGLCFLLLLITPIAYYAFYIFHKRGEIKFVKSDDEIYFINPKLKDFVYSKVIDRKFMWTYDKIANSGGVLSSGNSPTLEKSLVLKLTLENNETYMYKSDLNYFSPFPNDWDYEYKDFEADYIGEVESLENARAFFE